MAMMQLSATIIYVAIVNLTRHRQIPTGSYSKSTKVLISVRLTAIKINENLRRVKFQFNNRF